MIVGLVLAVVVLAAAVFFLGYRRYWFGLGVNDAEEAVRQEIEEADARRNTVGMETNPLARRGPPSAAGNGVTAVNPTFAFAAHNNPYAIEYLEADSE